MKLCTRILVQQGLAESPEASGPTDSSTLQLDIKTDALREMICLEGPRELCSDHNCSAQFLTPKFSGLRHTM